MTKVEEVARIIEAALERHGVTDFEGTIDDARDAIKAMREPTEAMRLASKRYKARAGVYSGPECYRNMIDAALGETE